MRKVLYAALSGEPTVMNSLPGGLFGDRGLENTPSDKPFGILTYEGPTPGVGKAVTMRANLWIHDNVGDYTRIDETHLLVRDFLLSLPPRTLAGEWITDIAWAGNSTDLFDDARGTNVKSAAYLLVGSGL